MAPKTSTALERRRPHGIIGPAITSELKALAEKNHGLLKPEAVVEAARDEDSPLHSRFTWDDGEAAEKYRLWQARFLISVSVQYVSNGKKQLPMKVFVSLSTDRKTGGYRQFVDVMFDDDQKNQLLMDSLAAMNHFQERYKQLSELRSIFTAIEHVKVKVKRKLQKGA